MIDKNKLLAAIEAAGTLKDLEAARVAALGKSSELAAALKTLGAMPEVERKARGAELNVIREAVEAAIEARKSSLESVEINAKLAANPADVSLSYEGARRGKIHPLSQVQDELVQIFGRMGFKMAEGPDIEDDWHNFGALNFTPEHPARDSQATFFIDADHLLRTQTSDVQIRAMEENGAPIKIITMGRVYRCDWDATHCPMFHQIEGLYIGEKVSMANLKGCLEDFLKAFFETDDVPMKLRPHYFPFTEPSVEVDIRCTIENGELKIGPNGKRWLEILGAGMVHPQVLRNVGVDPEKYQGFAFGTGIERLAMLKYGIPDMRKMFEGDARWLSYYGFDAGDVPTLAAGLSRR
ncbi:MAG: phenylalanine--tRNA ligase subunit alpha [Alphaproteobacteria bacterium]|nr:phenylalanine--tRNA ligase subunit alpha [Alphaproteobacteria bacterium]